MRRAPARPLLLALLAAVSAGCGLLQSGERATGGTAGGAGPTAETAEVGDLRLALLTAETPRLTLWIDAGSRDATPPQIATVAAWIAAEGLGAGARARVLPDGTRIDHRCDDPLPKCLDGVARALGVRQVDGEQLARLRGRLARHRRRALADPARRADALALEALLGDRGRSLQPLGRAEHDDEVTAEAVEGFLASHYGPARALLVVRGAADTEPVLDALEEVVDRLPSAAAGRRTPEPLGRTAAQDTVAVELDGASVLSAVTRARDARHAASLARSLATPGGELAARLLRTSPRAELTAHAFDVRGASLVLVRVEGMDDLEATAREVSYQLARLRREGPTTSSPDTRVGLGQRWIAAADDDGEAAHSSPDEATEPAPVGLGAIVPGDRADHTTRDDPDAEAREAVAARLSRALARGRAWASPPTRGHAGEQAGSVLLDNGARIVAQARRGAERVAIAVRWSGGAADDPPALHGRAALLATTAARACLGWPREALERHLGELDARIRPHVGPRSWGVIVDAPSARWTEALEVAMRCGTAPSVDEHHVEQARLTLLGRVADAWVPAWAAPAIAPRAPGLVAPLGSPRTIGNIRPGDVRRAWRRWRAGARLSVGIAGELPVQDAIARAARRAARVPTGRVSSEPRPGAPAEQVLAAPWDGATARVVVGWRVERQGASAAAARDFAERIGGRLDTVDGVRLLSAHGDRGSWGAWAAVGLAVDEQPLARLDAVVRGALEGLGGARPEPTEQAEGAPAPSLPARALALAAPSAPATRDPEGTFGGLAAASPRFVIGRPD